MPYLMKLDNDYRISFQCRYTGKLLSWVVKHDANWLIEYVLTAYPEIAEIVWAAVLEAEREANAAYTQGR